MTMICKYCQSESVIKYGKYKETQYYLCKSCNKKFSNPEYWSMLGVTGEYQSDLYTSLCKMPKSELSHEYSQKQSQIGYTLC